MKFEQWKRSDSNKKSYYEKEKILENLQKKLYDWNRILFKKHDPLTRAAHNSCGALS